MTVLILCNVSHIDEYRVQGSVENKKAIRGNISRLYFTTYLNGIIPGRIPYLEVL